MKTIKPYNTLIIVEKINDESSEKDMAGFIVPKSENDTFMKVRVVAVGHKVELPLKPGMIVHILAIVDWIDVGQTYGYTKENNIFGEVEKDD